MQEINLNERSPLSKAIPKKVINVEMFRAGEQTDSDGDRALFTERDLEDIISTYSPSTHEAPLIVGHDQNDSTPSLGWVREMWRKGKSLWGKIELTPKAEKLISEGIFKKVSSSFYAPEAEANPYPGKLALRHLALVNIPAVKGLADFREHLSETITVDFSEQRSQALFKELLDKNISIMAKPRKKKISNHAEGPMHVTINVGGSSGPGEDLPLYDDGGNQLSKNGTPVDYYEEEEELDGDPDFPEDFPEEDEDLESLDADFADEEELPPEEGEGEGEGLEEELPPEEGEGMEDPGVEDPGAEMPEGFSPEEGAEGEEPPEVEGADEIEDISDEMEGDDAKITELATNFSALELAKALMLQKETKDMMEMENTSDFSECDESKEKKKEEDESADFSDCEDEDKEDEESEDYSEDGEEAPEFAEDEDEESEDYSEDEDSKPDFLKKKESESECDSEDKEDFSEDEDDSESLKARVARLEKELTEQKKLAREKDISDFCEKVYQGGKLTEQIVTKTDLVRFMSSLNGKNSMNFSEGNKRSQFDFFSDVLENLPQLVNFSEVAPPATAPTKKKVAAPESGYAYENSNLELHSKALEFSEAKGVDYITALKTVIDL